MLDQDGLSAPSCHVHYDVVEHHWPETLDNANILGHKFVICPWTGDAHRQSPDGYKRAAELFNKAGEGSRKAGIQFGYHNHFWEFIPALVPGGQLPYDFLLEATNPVNAKMELDLCGITVAGKDPLAYFRKYPDRFALARERPE